MPANRKAPFQVLFWFQSIELCLIPTKKSGDRIILLSPRKLLFPPNQFAENKITGYITGYKKRKLTMTPAQKKAVKQHRKRQAKKGFVRVEVSVPDSDRDLIRQTAAKLRAGGDIAEQTRLALSSVFNPYQDMDLKELLENSPLGELELERSKETWRDIDL